MCSLSKTHDHFKKILLYGREAYSLMEVHVALSFKELNNKFEVNTSSAEDDLVAKGRSSTNDNK